MISAHLLVRKEDPGLRRILLKDAAELAQKAHRIRHFISPFAVPWIPQKWRPRIQLMRLLLNAHPCPEREDTGLADKIS